MPVRTRPFVAVSLAATLALGAVACGQGSTTPLEAGAPVGPPTSPVPDTTTTAAPQITFPLTGVPIAEASMAAHPAVVVKMDNSPDARPQAGINQADVVYELLVEGITRYAVVFHSEQAGTVGPVRSARSSDVELLANLGTAVIGWSGGNGGVVGEIRRASDSGLLVDAGVDTMGQAYWRERSRPAPHNLYTDTSRLLEAAPGAAGPPPVFRYRRPGEPLVGGDPAIGVSVDFGHGVRAEYLWDAGLGGWARTQRDGGRSEPTVDTEGVRTAPANVVVMFVEYRPSPADARSPMAISSGEGEALVLTEGRAVWGRWSRPTGMHHWELTDGSGAPILLSPGRTWVALPEIGSSASLL